MKTLLVILGPTGVGKTEFALCVAQQFGTEIVNCDSRQVYKQIPIGTAAPTPKEQQRVKHWFVGNKDITDEYNAAQYETDALNVINELFQNNDIVVLTGGSMMYIDAVCDGIDDIPTVDQDTRTLMKRRLEEEGLPALVEELHQLDPEHWNFVDKSNPRRVVHALEICHMTGKTYTSFRKKEKKERPFEILKIGLTRPREELYVRINQRVLDMIEQGFIKEAKSLYYLRELNSLNTVGYKELFNYFDGSTTLDEAIAKIQSNTRRYCRKHLTWFKRDERIKWFSPDDFTAIQEYIVQQTAISPIKTNRFPC